MSRCDIPFFLGVVRGAHAWQLVMMQACWHDVPSALSLGILRKTTIGWGETTAQGAGRGRAPPLGSDEAKLVPLGSGKSEPKPLGLGEA